MGSNLVPSVAGDQEKLLDQLFTTGATGQGGNKVGLTLNSLAQGFLPQPMQDWITADANENFGKLGARFGTDLGGQITRNLGLAGSQQALNAMHELFGLGGTTANFQFQRSENALDRALKEWQTSQQTDLSSSILMALLGGG